ncbi:MAG: CoA-binding protein, partial [Moorea sp. SIO3I7]|nr:CoA-binding protein [Moorena sp. SIO3I7]
HESEFYRPGSVGLITRGSYLIYEVALGLTQANLGQSIAINLGSEAIVGSSFSHWLEVLEKDKATNVIVLVDQTGGGYEDVAAAAYIAQEIHKPVISYIAGRYTPETQLICNPSARLSTHLPEAMSNMTKMSTAQEKVAVFKQGRIPVAERPSQIPILVQKALDH